MSHRTWPGKQWFLLLSYLVAVLSCQKPETGGEGEKVPPSEVPPAIAKFEPLFTTPEIEFCGTTFTSDLKERDGKKVGHVSVGNDDTYLYLTYLLEQNWYLNDVQVYAGAKSQIPRTGEGSPNHGRFPGKQELSPCDLAQSFTFRVLLSSLTTESEENCAGRYFTAMRASVRHIPNAAACSTGEDQEAWAAPIVINPGKHGEWATAFYYCKQDCPPPPPAWCAFGQGYWFASGKKDWGSDNLQQVSIGALTATKEEALGLWGRAGKRTELEKAFFQAAALKLSQDCLHPGEPMPAEIKGMYDAIAGIYTAKPYTSLNHLNNDKDLTESELETIKNAAGAIGKWICARKCDPALDPTDCTQ